MVLKQEIPSMRAGAACDHGKTEEEKLKFISLFYTVFTHRLSFFINLKHSFTPMTSSV